MTLTRVYGFWKYVSNLHRREARRYLEMFYTLKFRELVRSLTLPHPILHLHLQLHNRQLLYSICIVNSTFQLSTICGNLCDQVKTVPLSKDDEGPEEKTETKARLGPGQAAIVGTPASA